MFELLVKLQEDGWLRQIGRPKDPPPYRVGGAKVFFGQENSPMPKAYLLCLLKVGTGCLMGKDIPHLKSVAFYNALLLGHDPPEPRTRRRSAW